MHINCFGAALERSSAHLPPSQAALVPTALASAAQHCLLVVLRPSCGGAWGDASFTQQGRLAHKKAEAWLHGSHHAGWEGHAMLGALSVDQLRGALQEALCERSVVRGVTLLPAAGGAAAGV